MSRSVMETTSGFSFALQTLSLIKGHEKYSVVGTVTTDVSNNSEILQVSTLNPEILHSQGLCKTAMKQQFLQPLELSTKLNWNQRFGTHQNHKQTEFKTAVYLGENFVLLSCNAALIFSYWRFGTTSGYHPEDGTNSLSRNVSNYYPTLRNIPEEQRSYLPRGWIDKTRTAFSLFLYNPDECKQHQKIIPNYNQQDATILDFFISTDALHVSGGSSAHHQEHIAVHTASGVVNRYCCSISSMIAARISIGWQYPKAVCTVMCSWWWGRRNRLKHVEQL